MGWWWTNQESELRVRERCEVGVWGGGLTNESELRVRERRPFEEGVEDLLVAAVQLIHLIQYHQSEMTNRQYLLQQ